MLDPEEYSCFSGTSEEAATSSVPSSVLQAAATATHPQSSPVGATGHEGSPYIL